MTEKVDLLLKAGFELKASDIHITVGVPPHFSHQWRDEEIWKRIHAPCTYRGNGKRDDSSPYVGEIQRKGRA